MTKLKWPTFWNDGSISKGLTPPVLSNEKKKDKMLSPYSQLRVLTILSMAIATMHLQVYSYVTRVGPSIYWLTATIHSLFME